MATVTFVGSSSVSRAESRDPQLTHALPFISANRAQASSSGFILADLSLWPIYADNTAFQILNYSNEQSGAADWKACVQKRLQLIFQDPQHRLDDSVTLAPLVSGRRRYLCRSFVLDIPQDDSQCQLVALLMERPVQLHAGLLEANRRFQLSPRESETVRHLTEGLTTKEIAQRMNVSPNTVKQFVRLIMSKMSVTTRSGILGKLLLS